MKYLYIVLYILFVIYGCGNASSNKNEQSSNDSINNTDSDIIPCESFYKDYNIFSNNT